jgi:hypothetical protein
VAVTRGNPNSTALKEKIMKTNSMKWFFVGAFTVAASLSALAVVNIPNSFTAGQPIKASDVNDNFSSLKAAIDALPVNGLALPASLEGTNPSSGDALLKVATKGIGTAIWGISNDPTNAAVGVEGDTISSGGYGVYGVSRLETGSGTGVYGQAGSPNGIGVFGYNTASTGLAYGVVGKTKFGKAGVFGQSDTATGSGVEGHADGTLAAGVYGINPNGPGVWGSATGGNGIGVYGNGGNYGGYFESDTGSGLRIKTNTVGHNLIYALGPGDNNSEFLVDDLGNGAFRGNVSGASGKFTTTSGAALSAESTQSTAIIATSAGSGVTALIVNQRGNGNIMIGRDAANAEVFRVNNNGNVQVQGISLTSDRNAKKNFSSINSLSILEKVARLPISSWTYKTDTNNLRHIGPMAQDFHKIFGLNGKDDKHISSIDEQGVALAAIQGLYQQNQKLTAQLKSLEARFAKLEQK